MQCSKNLTFFLYANNNLKTDMVMHATLTQKNDVKKNIFVGFKNKNLTIVILMKTNLCRLTIKLRSKVQSKKIEPL